MLLYGIFEDKGYKFEAYIPDSDEEPVAFELRIVIDNELKCALLIPMMYVPTFGVDMGDRQLLESVLDRVLALLPESIAFSDSELLALKKLEEDIGGKVERKKHQSWLDSPNRSVGQFEYTVGLFAENFAYLLGSREAMDRWLETKVPELGDHTPEQALHLGMSEAVIKYLFKCTDQDLTGAAETRD